MTQTLTIAHSPDSDDIFMAYGFACGAVTIPGIRFEYVMEDIEVLNQHAINGQYPVTAISFGVYPKIADRYRLMTVGASMGEADYGPIVVALTALPLDILRTRTIAIPGRHTSSALILQMALPGVCTIVMPFHEILPAVAEGRMDAGVLIHESQMQFKDAGCVMVLDLPVWWQKKFNLPIPLGTNALRRDLDPMLQTGLVAAYRASIQYALDHRNAALRHTQKIRAGNLPISLLDQYVSRYVNRRTLAIGDEEQRAVLALLNASSDITPEWI